MARPRAADYDDKRLAILRKGAELFANNGYDRTSMSEIAVALGVSKALFYHYYAAKEDLLFDIIRSHLADLVEAVEGAIDPQAAPDVRLQSIVAVILDCYRDADAEHKIQINNLGQLSKERQAELRDLERRLVRHMADVVAAINPGLPVEMIKPMTMSIFGTLNWNYMWFRDNGKLSRESYAVMVTALFAGGLQALAASHDGRRSDQRDAQPRLA